MTSETDLAVEEQQQNSGLLARIKSRREKAKADEPVTLPDGWTVSASVARFMTAHPGSRFMGFDVQRYAIEHEGRFTTRVPWREHLHRGKCEMQTDFVEYVEIPVGTNSGALPAGGAVPHPEIWRVKNRGEPECIGFTLSESVRRRIGDWPETEGANDGAGKIAQQP